ncbi:3-oxoacyl-[acyl-carrier-protein] reductase FabG [Pseudoalteromonas holothuriae]|uniref:3-oxoacyl-[acyl-carrier-protein] reductase FabG n=1 Tax=Pseudoalteromonas holothuriae TaxID=2963714 RepID=A0A9W4VUZ6_9GAMM|nr:MULTISPECIES: SDR family NAD(P)-dependent oxidoreductase [unclassified Pseudoalteromonas]CAH9049694.1 3-oxoacyl-[acyl-carrier-protein] reductase FabG [Pseudoalteromonas sp. CIP111854]CAH9051661.1 3-oxoacyl-[acyl-carrier-protein] reductase FabG [Pseudoalteromonas sp. CIP111951]
MVEQIAVVTGAAGGFGAAICRALLASNYTVAAVDLNEDKLASLKHSLDDERLLTFVMDVTNTQSVQSVYDQLQQRQSSVITVLVNNAGILHKAFCLKMDSLVSAKQTFDVNLTGAFNCTTIFSQAMVRQKYGRIINIGSVAGIWGSGGSAAYAASKAGLIKASESWAQELGPMNICVTCVAPGICKTQMFDQFLENESIPDAEEAKFARRTVPIGRFGNADDVSEVVQFLATCKTNYLNSAVITIDGGMRVGAM